MEEQFYTLTKHAATFRIKSGVTKDGRITARDCEVWWNGGAYADIGPRITQKSGFTAAGPYDIENVPHRFLRALHQPAAGRRAARLRHPAARVGLREPHRHDRARARRSIRSSSAARTSCATAGRRRPARSCRTPRSSGARARRRAHELGQAVRSRQRHGPDAAAASRSASRRRSRRPRRSRSSMSTPTAASRSIAAPSTWGRAPTPPWRRSSPRCSTSRPSRIKVVHPDTDVTPYDMATLGSRSLYHMGNAVRLAAEDARDKLAALATRGRPVGGVDAGPRAVREEIQDAGRQHHRHRQLHPELRADRHDDRAVPDATPFWMVGGDRREVEVDTETGHVRVTKLINVADVGRADQPAHRRDAALRRRDHAVRLHHAGEDGVRRRPGAPTPRSPTTRFPASSTFRPSWRTRRSTRTQRSGPFGAKGVGESGTFGVSPAIANAIEDAVGVRLTALPLTPEGSTARCARQQGKPLKDD